MCHSSSKQVLNETQRNWSLLSLFFLPVLCYCDSQTNRFKVLTRSEGDKCFYIHTHTYTLTLGNTFATRIHICTSNGTAKDMDMPHQRHKKWGFRLSARALVTNSCSVRPIPTWARRHHRHRHANRVTKKKHNGKDVDFGILSEVATFARKCTTKSVIM